MSQLHRGKKSRRIRQIRFLVSSPLSSLPIFSITIKYEPPRTLLQGVWRMKLKVDVCYKWGEVSIYSEEPSWESGDAPAIFLDHKLNWRHLERGSDLCTSVGENSHAKEPPHRLATRGLPPILSGRFPCLPRAWSVHSRSLLGLCARCGLHGEHGEQGFRAPIRSFST
jgi:hypothetical protein